MITMGLLIIAFVGYQLWGTGIEFRANQRALADDFRDAQSSLLATTTVPPTTVPVTAAPTTIEPTNTVSGPATSVAPSTVAPTTAPAPTTPPVELGDLVGALTMPSIGDTTYYVVAGVRVDDLKRGVGHYPSTPLPGQYGNAALAGHRTTYGAPFGDLDKLEVGDQIIFESVNGGRFVYVVEGSEIINPNETRVLSQPEGEDIALLTLTTCHPKRSTKKRLVIYSRLDEQASTAAPGPRTRRYQPLVVPTTAPPTTVALSTVPATTAPAGAGVTTAAPITTVSPTTIPDGGLAGEDVVGGDVAGGELAGAEPAAIADADNLARGWFHDRGAWPHVLFWGGLLSLVAYGAWLLGRRAGHRWLAYVAGFAPFVLVLYFFFQNVNRLLPPGL
jgi:sortase A